jgi:polyisoprenoid-binding protein YceI
MKYYSILIAGLALCMLASCSNDNKAAKADVKNATETPAIKTDGDSSLKVNTAASVIEWTGSKPAGKHTGTIMIKEGEIYLDAGDIDGGKFTIDMNTITVTDLDGEGKTNLEGHLKGSAEENQDHFFNVKKYPTSTFEITKVAKLAGDADATHLVYGNLTIKDVKKEVGFKANINTEGGKVKVSTPEFTIDRSEFNVTYGSAKFFDDLKDKVINDDIVFKIDLVAG